MGLKEIEIQTESATVCSWAHSRIMNEKRVLTKGAAELIILQHLEILREMADVFELKLSKVFVPSDKNKANHLTRVRKL